MRIAPKGKYFIRTTDHKNGHAFFPFYDGFNTKREAQELCDKMNSATPNFTHEVIKNEKK